MEKVNLGPQPEIPGSEPVLEQLDRLGHGLAVLSLFDKQDSQKNFIKQASVVGSDFRNQVLNGPAYRGESDQLDNAIRKARYGLKSIGLQARYEHALALGIAARIEKGKMIIDDPAQEKHLTRAHGEWIRDYGSPQNAAARQAQKERLLGQKRKLESRELPIEPSQPVMENGVPTVYGPEGTYVDRQQRAKWLVQAINIMAWRSMLSGFGLAVKTDHHGPKIHERYENGTPVVEVKAANKRDRQLDEVKKLFWQLSGFPGLRSEGVMSENELKQRSTKMWEDFQANFEMPPNQPRRVAYRKRLLKSLPEADRPMLRPRKRLPDRDKAA